MSRVYFAILLLLVSSACSFAKRIEPQPVKPVRFNGITYSVPAFIFDDDVKEPGGYLEARDSKNNLIWRLQIYKTIYNPFLETDVQDVFITSLFLDKEHGLLIMSDEKNRVFAVDISTRKIVRIR